VITKTARGCILQGTRITRVGKHGPLPAPLPCLGPSATPSPGGFMWYRGSRRGNAAESLQHVRYEHSIVVASVYKRLVITFINQSHRFSSLSYSLSYCLLVILSSPSITRYNTYHPHPISCASLAPHLTSLYPQVSPSVFYLFFLTIRYFT
jgi:hypothetical protein